MSPDKLGKMNDVDENVRVLVHLCVVDINIHEGKNESNMEKLATNNVTFFFE